MLCCFLDRVVVEKIVCEVQDLWLVCLVLNGIICCGKEEELVWEECFKFFGNEIVVVYDVVGNYLFVNMIVSIILEKVYVCGVWIEDILWE